MDLKNIARATLFVAATAFAGTQARAADITGAGATFPAPLYTKWAEQYKKDTGIGLNYQAIGSGGGIKQIEAKTVTFGASDIPQSADYLNGKGLVQWPMVMGGIVAGYNLDGVAQGELVLDGPTLASIFLGKITKWDDAAIKKLNPSAKLPSTAISVVYRSDGSGTTYNFTNYLSKVSADWKSQIGFDQTVAWPTGVGGKGNDGVAGTIRQTKGSIGYVEYFYAKQNKIPFADMINHDGKKVAATVPAFQAAAANADWEHTPGYNVLLTDQPGAKAWPMTASTFIMMYKAPQDKTAAADALKFFDWCYTNGTKIAEDLDYIPMPAAVIAMVKKTWASEIKTK